MLDEVAFLLNDQVHNLGVHLDPVLLLDKQVAAVATAQSTFYQLWPFLEKKSLATDTHTLVTSSLDDCNLLCMGLSLEMTWKLK